jgi:hypothetical protein
VIVQIDLRVVVAKQPHVLSQVRPERNLDVLLRDPGPIRIVMPHRQSPRINRRPPCRRLVIDLGKQKPADARAFPRPPIKLAAVLVLLSRRRLMPLRHGGEQQDENRRAKERQRHPTRLARSSEEWTARNPILETCH